MPPQWLRKYSELQRSFLKNTVFFYSFWRNLNYIVNTIVKNGRIFFEEYKDTGISSFKNLKIFEKIGISSYFSITTNQITFFDQLNPLIKLGENLSDDFLFASENINFQDKKYSLKIKFEVLDCSMWQLKKTEYDV